MYNFNINGLIIGLVIFGALVMGIIWLVFSLVSPNTYKVKKKIEPIGYEFKVTDKGKTDTIWIYKR